MTSEKTIDNALDFRSSLLVTAMYSSPGSLFGKLKSIWMLAADLVHWAENKHGKLVKTLWGRSGPERLSLAMKAKKLPKQKTKPENTLLQAYAGLLREVATVRDQAMHLQLCTSEEFNPSVEDTAFITALLSTDNLRSEYFLNSVLPHFFALQLYCHDLCRMLNSPVGVPADPIVRQSRASKAGKASAVGDDVLRSRFSDFLDSLAYSLPRPCSNKAFFDKYEPELERILLNYQNNDIRKTRHPNSQQIITYGAALTPSGLELKFRVWKEIDPVFKERWENLSQAKK